MRQDNQVVLRMCTGFNSHYVITTGLTCACAEISNLILSMRMRIGAIYCVKHYCACAVVFVTIRCLCCIFVR